MANSSEILKNLLEHTPKAPRPVAYSFLCPNAKGFDNAIAVLNNSASHTSPPPPSPGSETPSAASLRIDLAVFAAATETFSRKNLNASIADSLTRFREVMISAKSHDLRVRAYISVALGCPYEGVNVSPTRVAELAVALMEMGADELSIGDTTGMGTAVRTAELLRALKAAGIRTEDTAMQIGRASCRERV